MKPSKPYFFVQGMIRVAEGLAMLVTLRPYGWSMRYTEWYIDRSLQRELRRRNG